MNQAEQRQAEVAGSWLTAIVDASDDAIVGITLDGVITSWNSGAQKLYGYSVQEAIGHSISILIPPDQPEEIPRILEKVRGGERLDRYETVHVCKNGRQLQVSIIVSPVRDAGGSVVGACAIARDITEHKRSEEKLRERETHLRVLTETMPTVPWSATPDGRIDYFSQRWLDLTGLTREQALGEGWQRAPHPEDLPMMVEAWTRSLETGEPYNVVHRIRTADGSYRWQRSRALPQRDEGGKIVRWHGITDDIHELREAQEALEESEERFRAAFEQAAVGIAHVAPDGRWLRVNRRLCEIVGYAYEELLEKTFQDITYPEDLDADLEQARRLLAGEIETYSMEKRYVRKNGSIVWVNLTGSLVYDDSRKPKYFIAVIEDISDRKRVEGALRTSHKDLEDMKFAIDESAIVAFTDQKGKITYVNDKFCQISKYSEDELLGQDHRIINSDYHKKEYIRNLWRTIAQGRVWRGELRNRAKDGSIYWVDTTIVPFLNEKAKPYQYVAIRHDITERKETEQRLQDALERLLALYEGGQVLGSSLQREEIGSRLIETMHRASGLSAATVEVVDERGALSTLCTLGEEDLLRRARSSQETQDMRREALESGERRLFTHQYSSGVNEAPLLAGLCLPLRVREHSIGLVEAYGPPDLLEQETVETLSGLANQAASALDNARLYEELAERERQLRELVGQILKAQEEERRRVAYEVHDGLAQVAAAAHQYLQGFAKRHSPESASGKEELREALELIQQAVREARQVISNLRPTDLDDFGLRVALRRHAEELSAAEELQVSFEETLGHQRLSQEAETTLFRVAQEALTNAKKHAQSPQARVKLERQESSVRLEVRDWGRGFGVDEVTNGGGGPGERVGISGMRERVAVLGGELRIESRPGAGTTVVAQVPLRKEKASGER